MYGRNTYTKPYKRKKGIWQHIHPPQKFIILFFSGTAVFYFIMHPQVNKFIDTNTGDEAELEPFGF